MGKIIAGKISPRDQRGAILIWVALLLVLLLGFAALAVDVGYLMAARNELQNVADSAALAGARELGAAFKKDLDTLPSETLIKNAVKDAALANKAAGESISVRDEDITIGIWNGTDVIAYTWPDDPPDAVRVIARRDENANNPITTFFARVISVDELQVSAEATAALTGPSYAEESELNTPFGLSQVLFDNNTCGQTVDFNPSGSCAAWHDFFWSSDPAKQAAVLVDIIRRHDSSAFKNEQGIQMISGEAWLIENFDLNYSVIDVQLNKEYADTPIPDYFYAGDEFYFTNGVSGTLFTGDFLDYTSYNGNSDGVTDKRNNPAVIPMLFDYFRFRDGDGDDDQWSAVVPVYEESGTCDPVNQTRLIVGFANIIIKGVNTPPVDNFDVDIDCNMEIIEGRGGGSIYGNLRGEIPNLVK